MDELDRLFFMSSFCHYHYHLAVGSRFCLTAEQTVFYPTRTHWSTFWFNHGGRLNCWITEIWINALRSKSRMLELLYYTCVPPIPYKATKSFYEYTQWKAIVNTIYNMHSDKCAYMYTSSNVHTKKIYFSTNIKHWWSKGECVMRLFSPINMLIDSNILTTKADDEISTVYRGAFKSQNL